MWSEQVYESRVILELSQSEFGEMLGVSARTVLRWEQGYTEISQSHLQNIADRVGHVLTVSIHPQRRVGECAVQGCLRPVAVNRRKYCSHSCAKQGVR